MSAYLLCLLANGQIEYVALQLRNKRFDPNQTARWHKLRKQVPDFQITGIILQTNENIDLNQYVYEHFFE